MCLVIVERVGGGRGRGVGEGVECSTSRTTPVAVFMSALSITLWGGVEAGMFGRKMSSKSMWQRVPAPIEKVVGSSSRRAMTVSPEGVRRVQSVASR